ncbi:transcriptional regulatory moc3 [Fusarium phyllophilum]|uniref:Transcriptional regulatory moc3 n=1 Tax=Fusarium phyllophilum TaxID=47803 RepID=A0A8H5ND31_9HYPO|nr:transcriptional regulatory moc3 [Fusarium phyllophilum]
MVNKPSNTATASASRRRRVYHHKVKTGCLTCRIKCDQGKPVCVRCTSTGRTCDGYTPPPSPSSHSSSTSTSPSPQFSNSLNTAADLKLILPRQSPDEVRSYRFFLEVTAPSLAGAFYADFWLTEVPRVCMSDAAIWHAVVSLGSAHEDFSEHGQGSRSVFALKQFNSAIRCLTDSKSPRHADRWRALIVSTIFTYVCMIKRLHDQTRLHLQAGCNLLYELQSLATKGTTSLNQKQLPEAVQDEGCISSVPVSIAPLQSILANLELHVNALDHGGMTESPNLLLQNKTLNTWRYYTAPRRSHRPTPDAINQAYCAAESLFTGLILFSQQHAKQLGDIQSGKSGSTGLTMLAARQQPYTRCYEEISKAISIFQHEVDASQLESHTTLPLHLFQRAHRLLLIQDPEEHDLVKRQDDLPALYKSIVDLAEQIMNLDPMKTRRVPYTQHLFLVAHSGIGQSTRRHAVALLRRPRLEGGWDSLISASLAEAIMDREREAACEYQMEQRLDNAPKEIQRKNKVYLEDEEGEEVNPMFRIFNITFVFIGPREARVVLRTWREKLDDVAGRTMVIRW